MSKNITITLLLVYFYFFTDAEADLEGGVVGVHAIFCYLFFFFFAITLKNWKLYWLKLNWTLIMNLDLNVTKYCHNMFNTQSFVVWQTVIMLFSYNISYSQESNRSLKPYWYGKPHQESFSKYTETLIWSKFTWDATNIKIKCKLPQNYVVLVYVEKVLRHF